jgi:hypothetical protein
MGICMYLKPDSSNEKDIAVIGGAVGSCARTGALLTIRERVGQVLMWRTTRTMTK